MNCYDELKRVYKTKGDFTAFADDNQQIMLSNLLNRIDSFALYTDALSGRSKCVSVYLPNGLDSVLSFYALCKSGCDINLIHISEKADSVLKYMDETESDILITVSYLSEKLSETLLTEKRVIFLDKFPFSDELSASESSHSDGRIYLHGGGTTGENKTTVLKQSSFCLLTDNLEFLSSDLVYGEGFSLMVLPMSHSFGLAVAVHTALMFGQGLIPLFPFDPEIAIDLMNNYRITFLVGVPDMFRKLLATENISGSYLCNLRLAFCGGDFVSDRIIKEFNNTVFENGGKAKLYSGYGLTECASVCTVNSKGHCKPGSCGKPVKRTEIKIIDNQIAVSSGSVMEGYLDSSFQPFAYDETGRKWLLTGDTGYIDKEGYLFITGREKRVFVISGYNIYPSLLENKINDIEGVCGCCALLVQKDNKSSIILYVCADINADKNLLTSKIKNKISLELSSFYSPAEIKYIESLPKTAFGKIDYNNIKNMIGEIL